jgi:hypothetical protein
MLFTPGDEADLCRVIHAMDERKDAFAAARESIRASVAGYVLEAYAKNFTHMLENVVEKHKKADIS